MTKEQFKEDINRLIDASESFYSLDPLLTKYMKMVGYRMELIEFLENNEKEVENTFTPTSSVQEERKFGGFKGGQFGGGGSSGSY